MKKEMRKPLMYWFTFLLVLLWMTSCDIQKQASKTKNDIDYSEWVKTETFRKGDTVTYIVPVVRYKDTVIYTTSTDKTTILRNFYNSKGEIYKNDCIPAEMKEFREEFRNYVDQSKTKESTKKEEIGMQFIPWIIAGIVAMFLIFMIVLLIYIRGQNKKFDVLNEFIKNKL